MKLCRPGRFQRSGNFDTWRLANVATPATTLAVVDAVVEDKVFFHTPSAVERSFEVQAPL